MNMRFFVVVIVLMIVMFAAPGQVAHAGTLVVNSDGSTINPGDGQCTLPEAIAEANASGTFLECGVAADGVGAVGADTILLVVNVMLDAINLGSSIIGGGQSGLPDITSDITIMAGGGTTIARNVAVATPAFRIAYIAPGGSLTLDGLRFSGGLIAPTTAGNVMGGAFYNDGTLIVTRTLLTGHLIQGSDAGNSDAFGGAIFNNGQLELTDSEVHHSTSSGGNGSTGITTGEGGGGGIFNAAGGTIRLNNVSIRDNDTVGGIGNDAADAGNGMGGGLFNAGTILEIRRTTFRGNSASGGIVRIVGNGGNGLGGAIFNAPSGQINLIINSTIAGNAGYGGTSSNHTGMGGAGFGAGIYNAGTGTITIQNSTIVDNRGYGSKGLVRGRAIGGGIHNSNGGTVSLYSSILADNRTSGTGSQGRDCFGVITSNDYNLIERTDDCTINGTLTNTIIGVDPQLDPVFTVRNNGGNPAPNLPPFTAMPLAGSPVIDAGDCALSGITVDQRGAPRPVDGTDGADPFPGDGCDIGAVELDSIPPNPPPQPQANPPSNSGSTSTAPSDTVTTNATSIAAFDPAISKLGFLQADSGQIVWAITIRNTSTVSASNIVVTDTLQPDLRIDRVEITNGSAAVNGQTVTVTIPSLMPGASITFNIYSTVTSSIGVGQITNTACVEMMDGDVCTTGLVVTALPQTGETPLWRNVLLFIFGLALILFSGLLHFHTRRRHI